MNNLFVVAGGKVEKLNYFKTNHHDVASHVRTYPVKILLGFSRSLCSAIWHKGKKSALPLAQAGCKTRESLVASSQNVAGPLIPKSKRHFSPFITICSFDFARGLHALGQPQCQKGDLLGPYPADCLIELEAGVSPVTVSKSQPVCSRESSSG